MLLIFVVIGVGVLAFLAAETRNWSLLVLVGYGMMSMVIIALLAGIRYLSRKMRTEGRNSRGEIELLRDATLAVNGTMERSVTQAEQAAERITSKLDLNSTAISRQRKELQDSTTATVDAVSKLHRNLKSELEGLSLTAKQLKTHETQITAMYSTLSALKGDISARMGSLEQIVSSTDLKKVKNELLTGLRETERKIVANTPKVNDVKRLRERLEGAESRILGTLESEAFQHGSAVSDQAQALQHLRGEVKSLSAELASPRLQVPDDTHQIPAPNSSELKGAVSNLRKHITATVRDGTRQVESLIHLAPYFSDKKMPMPSTGNFAIDAQALAHLITLVEDQRPKTILELGSGTSTIWLGYLCKSYGGKIITLDHLNEYLDQTEISINRHELNSVVEARLAPLETLECHDNVYNWYSKSSFEDLIDIDLLVVDGPPAATGKMARYPALPEIVAQLSDHATVVLDDAHREEETSIIDEWLNHFPEFQVISPGTSRLAVLRRGICNEKDL